MEIEPQQSAKPPMLRVFLLGPGRPGWSVAFGHQGQSSWRTYSGAFGCSHDANFVGSLHVPIFSMEPTGQKMPQVEFGRWRSVMATTSIITIGHTITMGHTTDLCHPITLSVQPLGWCGKFRSSHVDTGRAREDDRKSDLDRLLEKGADPSLLGLGWLHLCHA